MECRMRFKIINQLQVDLISFESIPPSVVHKIYTLYKMYRIFIHTKSCENSIQFKINLIPLNMITSVEMKAFFDIFIHLMHVIQCSWQNSLSLLFSLYYLNAILYMYIDGLVQNVHIVPTVN